MEFCYNEDTRIHTLDGENIPSVTQIIAPLSDFSMIPPAILARKCELGINFHKAIELYMLDDLDMDSLDPDIIKPMDTFIEWEKAQPDKESARYEVPLCNEVFKYCGKIDRISDKAITDFKLRLFNKATDTLQMSGYQGLDGAFKRKELTVLSFDIKGNLKIHGARNSQACPMFLAMLKQHKDGGDEQKFNKLCEQWKGHVKQ